MSIKTKKRLLEEDFLSDQQEKALTADRVAGTPENTEADDDFADLLGTPESEPAPAEPEAGSEEAKTEENLTDNVSALKDVINGLAVTVQKLTDKVDNMAAPKAEEAPAEGGEGASEEAPADLDLNLDSSADAGQDEQPAEGGEGGEQAAEPNTEDKPAEGGEQSSEESQGQDESAPGDEQKTEAYRMNKKAGKLLNSNTGSIIGIVESGKLYKLDEQLMTVVKAKIRQRIEEAKKTLKAELLGEEVKAVEPAAQDCGNEKQIDEKKESMSFLEKIKAAKAAKDCDKKDCDKDEKCDESKKCSDKSSEVEEDKDGKKKED
jgi:plasmid stability protein